MKEYIKEPQLIEKRSFEIITSELERKIVLVLWIFLILETLEREKSNERIYKRTTTY